MDNWQAVLGLYVVFTAFALPAVVDWFWERYVTARNAKQRALFGLSQSPCRHDALLDASSYPAETEVPSLGYDVHLP